MRRAVRLVLLLPGRPQLLARSGVEGGEAVGRYVDQWITELSDVTPLAREIHGLVEAGDLEAAGARLPAERPYDLPADVRATVA